MENPRYIKPVTAIIVGFGHRADLYAGYSLSHPEDLQIVGVADPDYDRCLTAQKKYGFPKENIFKDAAELAERPKFADAIINGTMDQQHVETSVPLLELGYDMLLEKPFACNIDELETLMEVVVRKNNKVLIGHILRYTPFYYSIKEKIMRGDIGDIINIQTTECVSYHHLTTSYVRGKWANSNESKTPMLLAKCCHDVDIMMWLMGKNRPHIVSSFGSKFQFKPENAPENAGTRCMVDCPLVDSCTQSAKKIYIDHPDRWHFYVWSALENIENPTIEDKINLLKGDSPYGRCVYKCDNNIVDNQALIVKFENGATGTHNLVGGASMPLRKIHIIGTKGEIFGDFEKNIYTVQIINSDPGKEYDQYIVDVSTDEPVIGHGGELAMMRDFVDYLRYDKATIACTELKHSVAGHLTIYLADKSREENGIPQYIDIDSYIK
ncbi:MAG TPA: Gfo/Idh/MocA family oxidoreductase [Clostridiales bacterium]|nr:Gfo/Idh/MocA family oxidoreductase [Clostridiales bacterium]